MTSTVIIPTLSLKIDGHSNGRVVAPITFRCIPLRPIIPSYYCLDFEVVGIEKKISDDEKPVNLVSKWAKGALLPCSCFSEANPFDFRLNLSEFAVGHELILIVTNIERTPRYFACGWLVHQIETR
jgi:hypothetical protein